ncbi:FAD-binding domain-containing protein [Novosphingobium sp. PASSN1]|uniref:FAD-binding domain-containing protein n=1 Tax=Novosphingobium sp. PASSN1 TaxID=2015561 RepID=UPI000BD55725|nr:FAD-binding domain-containing protein [Novosphingobium sp. PASSN1]OYU34051.1 MAG: DNA photolyase FAD-binding protein [Novosphingobium sp. PASSN1]
MTIWAAAGARAKGPAMFRMTTRRAALDRLRQFVPRAGAAYAAGRNTDPGPGRPTAVSRLSPAIRHRLLTEQDVVAEVLARHSFNAAGKFIQEVCWRTYWKGWLELRPAVWLRFLAERDAARDGAGGSADLLSAEAGNTGIDCFDAWARELTETGYLHNHARMWFASIWIFTLRLPWALGADFFLRHLIDADAASNTLSWRWVAGLQTAGKTYLARADNITRYTEGRFAPRGLAEEAAALIEPPVGPAGTLAALEAPDLAAPSLLLVHHEDLHPESLFAADAPMRGVLAVCDLALLWGDAARRFVGEATADAAARAAAHFGCGPTLADALDAETLIAAAQAAGVRQVLTPYAPVGPVADALGLLTPVLAAQGIALRPVRRRWDAGLWPHARRGFFAFDAEIEGHLRADGLL